MKRFKCILLVLLVLSAGLLSSVKVHGEGMLQELADALGVEGEILWGKRSDPLPAALHFGGSDPREMNYTFAGELDLMGYAGSACKLYMGTFIQEKGSLNLWERSTAEMTSGGLFQERLTLPRIGVNYLVIILEVNGRLEGRVYAITRKSESLEQNLLRLRLNLYEEYAP